MTDLERLEARVAELERIVDELVRAQLGGNAAGTGLQPDNRTVMAKLGQPDGTG